MRLTWTIFIAAVLPVYAFAQSNSDDMEQRMLQQNASQSALHECVKRYAMKYVKTSAAPQDVAEAAVSACNTENSMLVASTTKLTGSADSALEVLERAQRTAKRAAVRALLEARHDIH